MPKNAQGSWMGKRAAPIFPTYQTAGMLRPSPAVPPPVTPPPSAPPPQTPLPSAPSTNDRNRLIDAIIQSRSNGGGSGVGIFGIPAVTQPQSAAESLPRIYQGLSSENFLFG